MFATQYLFYLLFANVCTDIVNPFEAHRVTEYVARVGQWTGLRNMTGLLQCWSTSVMSKFPRVSNNYIKWNMMINTVDVTLSIESDKYCETV